jgi:hypothetical protein
VTLARPLGLRAGLALVALLAGPARATPSVAELDALHAARNTVEAAQALESKLRLARKESPNDFELLWRSARERLWVAENASDVRLKRQAGREAWMLAEEAMRQRPDRAEGYYYAAGGVGAYAEAVGLFESVSHGLGGQFLEWMEKAAALDPKFDRGGPLLALGRFYQVVPWPKQDLVKAEQLYQRVLTDFPESLRARLYLAQLKLKSHHPEEASALVDEVRHGSIGYDPAEGERIQALARSVSP